MPAPSRHPLAPPPDAADLTRPVRSPCISVCTIDPHSGLCEGCQRTLDEIATWGGMSDGERLDTWARIVTRREGLAR